MRMLIGSKRKTHCSVNSEEAARKKRTRNLYFLQDAGTASFRRVFRNTVASAASITAPSGQNHPQKKRPSATVRSATTSAGQTSPMSALPARVAAPAIRGSSRRNRLTAYGRTSLSLYSVFRKRNAKTRNTTHCEARRSVRVVFIGSPRPSRGSSEQVVFEDAEDGPYAVLPVDLLPLGVRPAAVGNPHLVDPASQFRHLGGDLRFEPEPVLFDPDLRQYLPPEHLVALSLIHISEP